MMLLLLIYMFTKGEFCDLQVQQLTTPTSSAIINRLFAWVLTHQIFSKIIPVLLNNH